MNPIFEKYKVPPKLSLIMGLYATEHLFKRSLETYVKQTLPASEFEIILVDDCSRGNAREMIEPYKDRLNFQYIRLEHPFGMRGNTISFNTAIQSMRGDIYCETTPEIMLHPEALEFLCNKHYEFPNERLFVSLKTYNLNEEVQLKIDSVDWREDINNIKNIEGFHNDWTLRNTAPEYDQFNGHQICSMKLENFRLLNGGKLWPKFCGYGEDDPYQSGERERMGGWRNITENRLDHYCMHQFHYGFGFLGSRGQAPMLNKYNHTMSNYMSDKSGHVPDDFGTAGIWDRHKDVCAFFTDDEIKEFRSNDEMFIKMGGDPAYLK